MKKDRQPVLNIGFTSILVVFLTLCLVTFSALSLLTANSDYKLSKKYADKTGQYYEADQKARETVCILDKKLYSLYTEQEDAASFYNNISKELFLSSLPGFVEDFTVTRKDTEDQVFLSYMVPVTNVQNLYIILKVNYPTKPDECFLTVTQWQSRTISTADEFNQPLHLYTGEN